MFPGSEDSRLQWAERQFLLPAGLEWHHLQGLFGVIFDHSVDFADLYFQYSRAEGFSLEEGTVKSGSFHISQGVGVRAIAHDKTAFAYSDELTLPALTKAAQAVRAIGRQGGGGRANLMQAVAGRQLYGCEDPIKSIEDATKIDILKTLEAQARALDPKVTQVMASLAAQYEVILVVRSDGRVAADVRPLVRVSLQVIMEHQGRLEQGSAGGGGRCDYGYFSDAVLAGYAGEAVRLARTNLEAVPAPAGTSTVVLGAGWPGILLHEAIGHGLEGDFNRKGSSAFSGRIGERVASPGVTVRDDGTLPARRGSLNIDDEGEPSQCTTLIEDGILVGYMQDSLNARLMGQAPTGNGRRESFAHLPMPRMTNTYMLGGTASRDEIIASVKSGLYAPNFGGGQVDITSGKFVFSTSEAWLIENGKLTRPVKGATLIGNGPDVLTRVSMIGNDMALDPGVGVCGKEGQSVPVGVGQPTLKIEGLTVGGTA